MSRRGEGRKGQEWIKIYNAIKTIKKQITFFDCVPKFEYVVVVFFYWFNLGFYFCLSHLHAL